MNDFKKWYNSKLTVGPYPKLKDVQNGNYSKYRVIINVCDFSNLEPAQVYSERRQLYFWFPMNELFSSDMGINSIYGALQVLHDAYEHDFHVYLHCYNGKNRSRVVEASLYYMMTGEHLDQISKAHKNRIFSNIDRKKLPIIKEYQQFLDVCKKNFSTKYTETKFGPLDMAKKELGTDSAFRKILSHIYAIWHIIQKGK